MDGRMEVGTRQYVRDGLHGRLSTELEYSDCSICPYLPRSSLLELLLLASESWHPQPCLLRIDHQATQPQHDLDGRKINKVLTRQNDYTTSPDYQIRLIILSPSPQRNHYLSLLGIYIHIYLYICKCKLQRLCH
jgi:hypothetical protein